MPRKPRPQAAGAYYHVFNRGVNRQDIFWTADDKVRFIGLLGGITAQFGLKVYAYCLMDNHYHLYLQTEMANLSQAIQRLQSLYAQTVNNKYDRIGPLFQSRFGSVLIKDPAYALWLVRYIHRNPCRKLGPMSELETFAWSSYAAYLGTDDRPDWLHTDWILSQFDAENGTAIQRLRDFHCLELPRGSDPMGSDPLGSDPG